MSINDLKWWIAEIAWHITFNIDLSLEAEKLLKKMKTDKELVKLLQVALDDFDKDGVFKKEMKQNIFIWLNEHGINVKMLNHIL